MNTKNKFKQTDIFGELLADRYCIEESMTKSSNENNDRNYQNNFFKLMHSPKKKSQKHREVVYLTHEQHELFRRKCFELDVGKSNYIQNLIVKDLLKNT